MWCNEWHEQHINYDAIILWASHELDFKIEMSKDVLAMYGYETEYETEYKIMNLYHYIISKEAPIKFDVSKQG